MSAQAPDQEPSIEEILASIRQIISDDDDGPSAASAAPEPVAPPPPPPPPAPEPEPVREDVLELKDPIMAEKPEIVMEEPEPTPPPVFDEAESDEESILTTHAKEAAVTGFARLADNIVIDKRRYTGQGVTLEDVTKELLQPMLREWLDDNLPRIIERLVQKELDKLAQRAMDE